MSTTVPRWSSTPPHRSGRYRYRQVSAPDIAHPCTVKVYADGSREIFVAGGDTLDNWPDYEFSRPLVPAKG